MSGTELHNKHHRTAGCDEKICLCKDGKDGRNGERGKDGKDGKPGKDGEQGRDGRDGHGKPGKDGRDGRNGERGHRGYEGPKGCDGKDGLTGPTGSEGPTGPSGGPVGPTGPSGVDGPTGPSGGPVGPTGANGTPGPTGAAGGISNFGTVLNKSTQIVPIEADVTFDTNGILTGNFLHTPGSSQITILNTGVYLVQFSVLTLQISQFTLIINSLPNVNTTYSCGAPMGQNNGSAILSFSAGDVLTLRNHSSTTILTLPSVLAGSQNVVNASLTILQLM